jgi:alginate O-acetyltransferase complex protein AlgI
MLFNSVEFLIFFPVVVIVYFLLPLRFRVLFLLLASYYFYMSWQVEYIILIIASTVIDYVAAKRIYKATQIWARRGYLFLSLASNFGILFFFKYFNFFNDTIQSFLSLFHISYTSVRPDVLLPVGISFYTFQTVSYTVTVYRGLQKPEHNFIKFALYVSFFPQLVAGPIERATRLLPQFDQKHSVDYARITDGIKLMTWGFFKKLVIADRLAAVVDTVYNDPTNFSGVPLILATYFFAFQIYCDFSAYSDIAIGAAKVLGYDLMENFRQPYFANSIPNFWHRWHISLSTWFRDYLYVPLGGNRQGEARLYLNLLIVFLASGLWHGANWTFVVWGALHGLLMIGFTFGSKLIHGKLCFNIPKPYSLLVTGFSIFVTFHLVAFSWIFFRAKSLPDALFIISHLFSDLELRSGYGLDIGGGYETMITFIALLVLILVDYLRERNVTLEFLRVRPLVLRWSLYYALVFSILLFGKFRVTEFIYFQF